MLGKTKQLSSVLIDVSGSATSTLVAAAVGETARIHRLFLTVSAGTATLQFRRGAINLTGVMTLGVGSPFILPFSEEPWFVTAANEAFNLFVGGAGQVSGQCEFVRGA